VEVWRERKKDKGCDLLQKSIGEVTMRNSVNIVVSAIVVMALAVLLLAGCQDSYKGLSATPSKNGKELQHHTPIPLGSVNMTTDSSKGDTMTAYIQRIKMEWWRELYGEPGVELDK
jgi:hypothetical protein